MKELAGVEKVGGDVEDGTGSFHLCFGRRVSCCVCGGARRLGRHRSRLGCAFLVYGYLLFVCEVRTYHPRRHRFDFNLGDFFLQLMLSLKRENVIDQSN